MSDTKWNYEVFWKEVINTIRHEISEQEYLMWFNNMSYHSSAELEILLSVPSSFYRDQVSKRYLSFIEEKLYELSGNLIKLSFVVSAQPKPGQDEKKDKIEEKKAEPKEIRMHPRLHSDYNFEKFVIGENNSFAANAAFAIAKNPGTAYNPCLIYGGVGLGKTHLIPDIGNQAYQQFHKLKVVYDTA
ncbi:MAG: chromosomal replication initiator protein DnaA, partial [Spirochaetaceae bacterium]